ncbi:hypothetical protein MTR_2g058630 [Medicago truncatula]|uniref:Uncharacterized protein n=1 Tax=Medicago truncatula TaxID=3880 RepID=G7IQM2_MEDTR|nr:hypothetical protein MTR_2g058630 [Medicago truncatula]
MTVKPHGHAELSQYEILDLFVIQYISESRNINIDLYKGDNIYALGSIKEHTRSSINRTLVLKFEHRVLEEHCLCGLARGFAACCLLCFDRDSRFQISHFKWSEEDKFYYFESNIDIPPEDDKLVQSLPLLT